MKNRLTLSTMFAITRLIVIFSIIFPAYSIRIGIIQNNIIIGQTYDSVTDVTRDQCVCYLIGLNATVSVGNYFQNNQTCQLFQLNTNSVIVQYFSNSSFIFLNQSGETSIGGIFRRIFV